MALEGRISDEALDKSSKMAPRDDPGAMAEDSVTDGNLLIRFRLLLVASTELVTTVSYTHLRAHET